jgi:NTE family protein
MGCWKAFLEWRLPFAAAAGSSIGALNAALVCQGDWYAARRLWEELADLRLFLPDPRKLAKLGLSFAADLALFFLPVPKLTSLRLAKYALAMAKLVSRYGTIGVLGREGLVDMERFEPIMDRYLDLDSVLKRPASLFVTVFGAPDVGRPGGSADWFRLQDFETAEAKKILAASMALPVVFAPVEMNGKLLTDGGIGQWLPLRPLYDAGVRKIIAVATRPGVGYKPDDYPGCEILLVRPENPLGRFPASTLSFTAEAVDRWVKQGYEDAARALEKAFGPGGCLRETTEFGGSAPSPPHAALPSPISP